MKTWLKGGLIGFLVPLLISGIVYKAHLFHPLAFVLYSLLPAVFWMVVGIGAGLMIQKRINMVWKILILLILLIPFLVSASGGFECGTVGGWDRCHFIEYLGGIAYPILTHGMFIISGPAFMISLILIILSATRVLKDKEIKK